MTPKKGHSPQQELFTNDVQVVMINDVILTISFSLTTGYGLQQHQVLIISYTSLLSHFIHECTTANYLLFPPTQNREEPLLHLSEAQ